MTDDWEIAGTAVILVSELQYAKLTGWHSDDGMQRLAHSENHYHLLTTTVQTKLEPNK